MQFQLVWHCHNFIKMIHYTLLPEKEIKLLKREYKTRFLVFLLFFVSGAVLLGIGSLVPAYIYSFSQAKDALSRAKFLQESRQQRGVDEVLKELKQTDLDVKKLQEHQDKVVFSNIITQLISSKTSGIRISSFTFSNVVVDANSKKNIFATILQGKANTRENLVEFKKKLESDPSVLGVELPVSDLAKSKDIAFSLKISMIIITK